MSSSSSASAGGEGPRGDRGPQGDHGQEGQEGRRGPTGERGETGADGITLDRLPLTVLLIVVTLLFAYLIWRDHTLSAKFDKFEYQIVRLQDQVTDLRQP